MFPELRNSPASLLSRFGAAFRYLRLKDAASIAPGLMLAAGVAWIAAAVVRVVPGKLGATTVAILLGILLNNLGGVGAVFSAGLSFAGKTILRVGIVLLGSRLLLTDALRVGWTSLVMVVVLVAATLLFVRVVGRALGVSDRVSTLIGVGTAICGNSAIMAAAPVIRAREREVTLAVTVITLFGTTAVLLYPVLGRWLGLTDAAYGMWAGLAVHDTAQAVAAGFAYSSQAGEISTIVKLARNVMMAFVILSLPFFHRDGRQRRESHTSPSKGSRGVKVPGFVVGFLFMAGVNTSGLITGSGWSFVRWLSGFLILVAVAAVGLRVDVRQLVQLGWRPLVLGLVCAVLLSAASLVVLTLV